MESANKKRILISGASMAGLSAAWWMNKTGYKVTVVEMANEPRINGAAVDIKGTTIGIVKRMSLFEQLKENSLGVEKVEMKNAADVTEGTIWLKGENGEAPNDDIEIERDKFVSIMLTALAGDVEFRFGNSITALRETKDDIDVTFADGAQQAFHLVFGCDGMHSNVRKLWFGNESEYAHFLDAYFSITIVNKLLVPPNVMQIYNEPGRAIMLNAYNGKTDIIFCFLSHKEIPYDYRNAEQQQNIILQQFKGQSWRTAELLEEVKNAKSFYFDKFCQIKMPSWTKGRVALVGDAAYCASPAAGMGASLAIEGAAALADALQKHNRNFEVAFAEYNKNLRPFIEEIQATARVNVVDNFIPATEEAIQKRNTQATPF